MSSHVSHTNLTPKSASNPSKSFSGSVPPLTDHTSRALVLFLDFLPGDDKWDSCFSAIQGQFNSLATECCKQLARESYSSEGVQSSTKEMREGPGGLMLFSSHSPSEQLHIFLRHHLSQKKAPAPLLSQFNELLSTFHEAHPNWFMSQGKKDQAWSTQSIPNDRSSTSNLKDPHTQPTDYLAESKFDIAARLADSSEAVPDIATGAMKTVAKAETDHVEKHGERHKMLHALGIPHIHRDNGSFLVTLSLPGEEHIALYADLFVNSPHEVQESLLEEGDRVAWEEVKKRKNSEKKNMASGKSQTAQSPETAKQLKSGTNLKSLHTMPQVAASVPAASMESKPLGKSFADVCASGAHGNDAEGVDYKVKEENMCFKTSGRDPATFDGNPLRDTSGEAASFLTKKLPDRSLFLRPNDSHLLNLGEAHFKMHKEGVPHKHDAEGRVCWAPTSTGRAHLMAHERPWKEVMEEHSKRHNAPTDPAAVTTLEPSPEVRRILDTIPPHLLASNLERWHSELELEKEYISLDNFEEKFKEMFGEDFVNGRDFDDTDEERSHGGMLLPTGGLATVINTFDAMNTRDLNEGRARARGELMQGERSLAYEAELQARQHSGRSIDPMEVPTYAPGGRGRGDKTGSQERGQRAANVAQQYKAEQRMAAVIDQNPKGVGSKLEHYSRSRLDKDAIHEFVGMLPCSEIIGIPCAAHQLLNKPDVTQVNLPEEGKPRELHSMNPHEPHGRRKAIDMADIQSVCQRDPDRARAEIKRYGEDIPRSHHPCGVCHSDEVRSDELHRLQKK